MQLQYLGFPAGAPERKSLLPVLATLLQLSAAETKSVASKETSFAGSFVPSIATAALSFLGYRSSDGNAAPATASGRLPAAARSPTRARVAMSNFQSPVTVPGVLPVADAGSCVRWDDAPVYPEWQEHWPSCEVTPPIAPIYFPH